MTSNLSSSRFKATSLLKSTSGEFKYTKLVDYVSCSHNNVIVKFLFGRRISINNLIQLSITK